MNIILKFVYFIYQKINNKNSQFYNVTIDCGKSKIIFNSEKSAEILIFVMF